MSVSSACALRSTYRATARTIERWLIRNEGGWSGAGARAGIQAVQRLGRVRLHAASRRVLRRHRGFGRHVIDRTLGVVGQRLAARVAAVGAQLRGHPSIAHRIGSTAASNGRAGWLSTRVVMAMR